MSKKFWITVIIFITAIFLFTGRILPNGFSYPFTSLKLSPIEKFTALDLSSVLAGARRLGADIAWIQLLQYYGSPEEPIEKDTEFTLSWDMSKYLLGIPVKEEARCHQHHEHYHPRIEGGNYPDLQKYCYRVVNLDPFFYYAYLYGAGALAWNLNRTDEAIELLKSGIDSLEKYQANITNDPRQPFWQFNLYISAIVYRKMDKFGKMSYLLEIAEKQPNCPNIVKSILANIYENQKNFIRALKLWVEIYDSKDPNYKVKSEQKISDLRRKLNL